MMLLATVLFLSHLGVEGQNITVTIEADPDKEFYSVGENLTLMCVLDPIPSDGNVSYFWECSGCFADGVAMQTIIRVLNDSDGGSMINCSVIINDSLIMSDMTFDLQVIQGVDGQDITVTIEADPDKEFYTVGETLTLMCVPDPIPSDGNVSYFWECSGCFADGVAMPTISRILNDSDGSSMINCSVIINDNLIISDMTFDLQVIQATTAVSLLTATAVPTIAATTTVLTTTAPMLLLQTTVPNTTTTDPTGTPILLLQSTAPNSAPTSAPTTAKTTANTTVAATSVFTTLTTAPILLLHTTAPTTAFTSPVLQLHTTAATTEITTPTTAVTFSIAAVIVLTTTETIASTTATTVSTTVTTVPNAASTAPTTNAIVPTTTTTVPTIAFTTSNTAPTTEITAPVIVPIAPTTAPTAPTNMTVFDGSCQPDNATCVTEFYPFGLLENDNVLTNIDDDASEPIVLSETFKFYGQTINIIYVGSNGIISLNSRYNPFTPSSLPISEFSFIAPYWADVDLTGIGQIYYRQTSNSTLLARATSEIQAAFSVSQNVSNLFVATWVTVGYYPSMTDRINTFQCVLGITSEAMSYVMFLYADGEIQWANDALAGINAGDGVNSITIPGSLTPNILNVSQTSNVGIPGIWMFQGQPSSYIFLQPNQPIVGQRQDVICSISVSVDLDIVELGWLNEEVIVTNDSRVTIVELPNNFTFNSSITGITTIIRFDPLLEIDEGNYTCYYSVENETETTTSIQLVPTHSVTVIALTPEEIDQLLEGDCSRTSGVLNAESQTVGDPLILRCNLNIKMLNNSVNFEWSSNNMTLRMANQVRLQDYYVISQLNTSNDGQEYKCEAMISTTPPITVSGVIMLDLTVPDFIVTTSLSDSEEIMIGNSQDIQCTVEVGFDGVELNSVIVDWLGPKGTPITYDSRVTVSPTSSSDNTFVSILRFSYLMENDSGRYTCCVMILSTNHSDSIVLRKPNVPTPNVVITVAHNDILVGQPFSLECIITTVRGISSQVNIIWSKGSDIEELKRENVSANVTMFSSVMYRDYLNISQITTDDDNETYRCEVIINSSSPVTASDNYTLHVIGISFGDSKSDRSTPSWIIVGISAGVILIIATTLMCLLLLRKRRSKNKILRMRTADFNLHPLNNPTYDMTLKNITAVSKSISVEEWKKELAGYLIDYQSLDIKNTIASGKFGIVYKALYTSKEDTIIEVAVKTVKYFSSETAESFVKECNIANKFDHPNVLSLIGVCVIPEEDVPLMVMPYMHHGDVKSFVKSKRENNIKVEEYPSDLSEEILTKMCHDVAKGMEYLAIKHFVHRDLAARNCMLDQSMTAKVADFGLSRDVYVTEYYTTSHSTPLPVKWLAPEALFDRHFNEKSDVWAFGVTCWEVFSLGLQPYPLIGPSEIGDYIKSGKILAKPQLSSDKMYEMMKTCWKFKADERPNFSDLVKTIDHLKSMPRMTQSKKFIKKESTTYLLVYS